MFASLLARYWCSRPVTTNQLRGSVATSDCSSCDIDALLWELLYDDILLLCRATGDNARKGLSSMVLQASGSNGVPELNAFAGEVLVIAERGSMELESIGGGRSVTLECF